jgi:hypothetical protein
MEPRSDLSAPQKIASEKKRKENATLFKRWSGKGV